MHNIRISSNWTVALLWGVICAVPLSIVLWTIVEHDRSYMRLERDAQRIIAQFHQRLNAEDFDAICEDAVGCKGPSDLADNWWKDLEGIRRHFGAFRAVRKSHVMAYIEPPSVQVEMDSSFEEGVLHEKFVLRKVDGQLRLVLYEASAKIESTSCQKNAC